MAGKPETPRDAIVARLDGRTMSWLARELSERSGASFAASRSNLYRWLKGDVSPTARYAVLLSEVLGGDAEDYGLGTPSRPNRVSRAEFERLVGKPGDVTIKAPTAGPRDVLPAGGHELSAGEPTGSLFALVGGLEARIAELEERVSELVAVNLALAEDAVSRPGEGGTAEQLDSTVEMLKKSLERARELERERRGLSVES